MLNSAANRVSCFNVCSDVISCILHDEANFLPFALKIGIIAVNFLKHLAVCLIQCSFC